MFDSFPLARYFTRIGYHGPAEPTLEVLRQLHLLHPQAIPFENIDAYSGLGVSLDLARIADKMLARGRGGYCFEHNRLFQAVLEQLGFRVTPLIARVRWQVPADVRTGSRTCCCAWTWTGAAGWLTWPSGPPRRPRRWSSC